VEVQRRRGKMKWLRDSGCRSRLAHLAEAIASALSPVFAQPGGTHNFRSGEVDEELAVSVSDPHRVIAPSRNVRADESSRNSSGSLRDVQPALIQRGQNGECLRCLVTSDFPRTKNLLLAAGQSSGTTPGQLRSPTSR